MNQSTSEIQSIRNARAELNNVIGTRELSAWQIAPGLTWVQTRSPKFNRLLARRSDARLVASGVSGGFLRTFAFQQPLTWARKLIARYIADETVPNEPKTALASPVAKDNA